LLVNEDEGEISQKVGNVAKFIESLRWSAQFSHDFTDGLEPPISHFE
jgi:hypothetical protein